MTPPSAMFISLGIATLPLLLTRNVTFASVFLFVPLPFIAWRLDASGMLLLYRIFLPSVVGFTHFLSTRRDPALALEKKARQ